MIFSDNVATTTGLARIARELTQHIHEHLGDVIEVCSYGPGPQKSDALPWKQYEMKQENLLPINLKECWEDFAQGQRGAVLVIWNVSFVPYFSFPDKCPNAELRAFIESKPFATWTYTPIDGDCRPGMLPLNMAEALCGFDRVAHYTNFAKRITDASIAELYPNRKVGSAVLPHGLDTSVFHPRDREEARKTFYERATGEAANPIKDDVVMVGVIATNSSRKDFPLVFQACAELLKRGVNVGLFILTDHPRKCWDMIGLAREYGMGGRVIFSRPLNDDELAWVYSGCDVTLAPASGGGWELPLMESVACGCPPIHGNYAGGAELLPSEYLVEPLAFRSDGFFSVRRPCHSPEAWADAVQRVLGTCPPLPSYVPWGEAWKLWVEWLLAGVK